MNIFKAILLGIIQGATEFLPVSSSGHLIIFQKLFGLDPAKFGLTFDIALHFATLIVVFMVFWKDIVALIKKPFQKYVLLLIIATIPAGIIGVLFNDTIENISASGGFLGLSFILTACILWSSDYIGKKVKEDGQITNLDAAIVGVSQAVAILPGVSRSGTTMGTGMMRGMKKEAAVKFAFLMSIPVVGGSVVLGAKNIMEAPQSIEVIPLIAGMLAAGISGYFSVKFLLNFLKKKSLKVFAIYVLCLGVIILLDQLFFQKIFDVFLVYNM